MLDRARAFYQLFSGDASVEAEVRAEAKALAKELVLNQSVSGDSVDGSMLITSATVNGQSFAGSREMTKGQHLRLLTLIIKMYDEDVALSSRSYYRGPI